MKRGNNYC